MQNEQINLRINKNFERLKNAQDLINRGDYSAALMEVEKTVRGSEDILELLEKKEKKWLKNYLMKKRLGT